ncbi:hypothetical protein UFOVP257_52 [uncultured Caudovirales phage]|uniref:Single-stranded DNA-binding protein n=1 Tax=uncultured Caudovirales phage TaxID=2100421 RepID=A0A6J5LMY7_9CAUD|nr:hypothetical protein UFOVP257_52 [uncultured Caudovirales phage]
MATTLAEIRAKLQAQENRSTGNTQSQSSDNAIYPHWNIPEGSSAKVRFLPDANPKNDFFWVERQMIKLEFAGIKGQPESKKTIVQVPCVEMYGKEFSCPILTEVRPWFKDPGMEELGRKYWKKKSYLFQGFVKENPLADDKTPTNPIRRFIISPQIFTLIKASLMDTDLESMPIDYENGLDFVVTKTSKGGYADYSTSKWARKESALAVAEQAAIEEFGLYNLSDYLPKQPGEEELQAIKEMFEASVNGEAYDPDRWGKYYKPAGFGYNNKGGDDAETSAPTSTVTITKAEPSTSEDDDEPAVAVAPVVTPAAKPSSQKAEDILAMIRNRSKQ